MAAPTKVDMSRVTGAKVSTTATKVDMSRVGGAKPKKKGGGFLGGVGHFFGQGGADLYHAAVNTPAGLYYAGKAVGGAVKEDVDQAIHHPLQTQSLHDFIHGKKGSAREKLGQLEAATARQTGQDLRHPLKHPGLTALDLLGIASLGAGTAARAGEVGRVASAGGGIRAVARAAVHGPAPGVRTFKVGDLEVTKPASKAASTRAVHRVLDTRRARAAEQNPGGRAARAVAGKAGKALEERLRIEESVAKAPAAGLQAVGKRLKPSEQMALRVVAEEAPLEQRLAAARARQAAAKGLEARRHGVRVRLLEQTRQHLVDATGKPELATPRLKDVYAKMEKVAGSREQLGKELALLTDEMIQGRKTAAGRAAMGATYEKPTPGKLGTPSQSLIRQRAYVARLEKLHATASERAAKKAVPFENVHTRTGFRKQDLKTAPEAAFRRQHVEVAPGPKTPGVPSAMPAKGLNTPTTERLGAALSVAKDRLQQLEAAQARRIKPTGILGHEDFTASPAAVYVPDIEQKAGRSGQVSNVGGSGTVGATKSPFRKGYTGGAKERAREPLNTTKAVAEANLAVTRYARLVTLQKNLRRATTPAPRFKDDVAVRLDKIGSHEPLPADVRSFVTDPSRLEQLTPDEQTSKLEQLRKTFILGNDQEISQLAPAQVAEFERLHREGKIGWVPRKLLGDLAKAHAPLAAVAGKPTVAVLDAINNGTKLSVLYLKLAYAVPNFLGNAALNLVQQGFAAPKNLARAVRLTHTMGPELTAHIDTVMGEGFATSLRGEQGKLSAATQAAANIWGKGVDKPFRRASFLHEAAIEGFRSPTHLEKLLTEPAHHETLINVVKRANREIIDYGRLSSKERELVRRIVFFYPWVKGSTLYAGNFLTEHPIKAAAAGQIGTEGRKRSLAELGPTPSFLEGAFKGPGGGLVNPSSAAILQTPAQVGAALTSLAGGRAPNSAELSQFLTPGLSIAANEIAGRNLFTRKVYGKGQKGLLSVLADTLLSSAPQTQLIQGVRGKTKSKLYPASPRAAIARYLIGGLYPRPYNPARLHQLAIEEQRSK